jgi:hypothetical protein
VDLKKHLAAMRRYHEVYGEWPPPLGPGAARVTKPPPTTRQPKSTTSQRIACPTGT